MMKRLKKTWILILIGIVVICFLIFFFFNDNWPSKFQSEFNQFFGKENWECVSEEVKKSKMYEVTYYTQTGMKEQEGRFKNWNIEFKDKNGDKNLCIITNHTLKINNDRNGIFSPKRYSEKQALILELMDVSFQIASNKLFEDLIASELPRNQEMVAVSMSYYGGNPEPEFYDKLWKQPWFTAEKVTAKDFLSSDLYRFKIRIETSYKVKGLSSVEKQELLNNFKTIENKLLQEYKNNATFDINFNSAEYRVQYVNGIKK